MLTRSKNFILHGLWETGDRSSLRYKFYAVLRLLWATGQELAGGQLTLRAMSLVYITLLSLVPLLAVSFSVLKAFGVHNQIEPLLLTYLEPLGSRGEEIVLHILGFVDNMKVGVLGSLGVAMLLYTVVALTQKVEAAFNYVWRVSRTRSLPRRFSDYLSVIMVGPVLVFTAIGITATLMSSSLAQTMLGVPAVGHLVALAGKFIPFVLIITAFVFVYMFVPNTKVRFRSALVGAMVSGVLWQSSGYVFAAFVAGSNKYTAVYSGFAILMFFMIWLYLSWFILLIGAQLSYYHQHPQQLRPGREEFHFSARLKEQAGLALLYLIVAAFYQGRQRWTQDELIEHLGLPGNIVSELLTPLERAGLLVATAEDNPGYMPARDPAQILISEALDVLRQAEEAKHEVHSPALDVAVVKEIGLQLRQARDAALAGRSLKDLMQADNAQSVE